MASLNSIVSVAVSALTAQVQQPGFGVPLIVDYHTRFAERVRFYDGSPAGLTAMLADGFTVNDAAYLAASALISQSPSVPRFGIGRRALAPDQQVDLTPTVLNSTVYAVALRGPAGLSATASFTSDASATLAEIVTGLVSAINTAAVGITATDVGATTVRCKASTPGLWFSVSPVVIERLSAKQTHADPGIATDLGNILQETQDFYGMTLTTMGAAEIAAMATWVEANKRLAILSTQDGDAPTVSAADILTTLRTANHTRTAGFWKRRGDQFQGAAVLGSVLPIDPGGVTFWGRKLAGQDAETLTESQITFISNKNGMWFTSYGGISITREGKAAGGQFLDITRDRDWLEATLQTDIFTVLTQSNKIPYTDQGAALILGAVKARLNTAITVGVLAANPAPVVIGPKVANVAPADRTARIYKTITFTGTFANAIQKVEVTGTVSV